MICLAIDTAGPVCAAALAEAGDKGVRILARKAERIGRGHAERLMPMISEVLEGSRLSWTAIGRVAVAAGPGSFTGVRIGVATARGLALALDIPAFGIDVLAALIEAARADRAADRAPETAIIAALDARRDAVYLRAESAGGHVAAPSALVELSEIRERLQPVTGRPLVVVGSGADAVRDSLAGFAANAEIRSEADHADIATIAALGLAGAGVNPPAPLYLRAPDARPQASPALLRD